MVDCQGHDSERMTETFEMMDTGFARNFITVKKQRFNIAVEDVLISDKITKAKKNIEEVKPGSQIVYKGQMQESLIFQTDYAAPLIIIKRATYGELNDLSKCIDVTALIQAQVKGRVLQLDTNVPLQSLFFKDPSPGRKKQLHIHYINRGFIGNVRVREKNDCLVAKIELGYPPLPPPDDANIIVSG